MDEKFKMFMETVDECFRSFANQINEYLTENGCKDDMKLQKSGYVESYVLNSSIKLCLCLSGTGFFILAGNFIKICNLLKLPIPQSN